MAEQHHNPTTPKNGSSFEVLIVARISTVHQDERSLGDQIELCRHHATELFPGQINFTTIQGQGSGEFLDRADYLRAIELVQTGGFDAVVVEDLARICRRAQANIFCERCEDNESRFVAINDSIDTTNADWRLHAFFASIKHEMSNKDTAARIRRSLRNRFNNGGVLQIFPYGYIKPAEAKSDADVQLDAKAADNYRSVFEKARDGASYFEIADWLNSLETPTGGGCRTKKWTGPMVARVMHNPILKGYRRRNKRMSKRVNKTGKRRSVLSPPNDILLRHCPHLAVFAADYYDETIAIVDRRNAGYKRKLVNGRDSREGISRKRTQWPGQHMTCGVCGRPLRYGGHGQKSSLMCRGAYGYQCWNSITVDGPTAAKKIADAIFDAIGRVPEFDSTLVAQVEVAIRQLQHSAAQETSREEQRLQTLHRQIDNTVEAIAAMGRSSSLTEKLRSLESEQDEILLRRKARLKEPPPPVTLPAMEEIRSLARERLRSLASLAPEFGRLMTRLIPKLEMRPVRLCDGGTPHARAYVTLDLSFLVDAYVAAAAPEKLTTKLIVDLFDPPQRVMCRQAVNALAERGLNQRSIAKQLGIHLPTVQAARKLTREMIELKSDDPYRVLVWPPDDYAKMRRHKHDRFQFEVAPGFSPE